MRAGWWEQNVKQCSEDPGRTPDELVEFIVLRKALFIDEHGDPNIKAFIEQLLATRLADSRDYNELVRWCIGRSHGESRPRSRRSDWRDKRASVTRGTAR
jgi:hypothetical protein